MIIKMDNCSICSEPITKELYVITKCNHVFHPKCLNEWMNSKLSCPLCREAICTKTNQYIGITLEARDEYLPIQSILSPWMQLRRPIGIMNDNSISNLLSWTRSHYALNQSIWQ